MKRLNLRKNIINGANFEKSFCDKKASLDTGGKKDAGSVREIFVLHFFSGALFE
jgi:hypothetical protein